MPHFIVMTGSASMQGYVRFIMIVKVDGKYSQSQSDRFKKNFVILFPILIQ